MSIRDEAGPYQQTTSSSLDTVRRRHRGRGAELDRRETLRESARSELIAADLAEGKVAAAHRRFEEYAVLLWAELRQRPSPGLVAVLTNTEQAPSSTRRRRETVRRQ